MGKKQEIPHWKAKLGPLKIRLTRKEKKVWLMKPLLKSLRSNYKESKNKQIRSKKNFTKQLKK